MKKLIILLMLFGVSCTNQKKVIEDQGATEMTLSNTGQTTCQLIEKPFVIKNGVETDQMELYLRCSIQDYFIKLCESDVSRKELEKYLDSGITVEMEIIDGEWDRCPGDPEVQSRIGKYVVIRSIVE